MKKRDILLFVIIMVIIFAVIVFCYARSEANKIYQEGPAGTLSEREKEVYNAKFDDYMGEKVNGKDVKELINKIADENYSRYGKTGESGNFLSISTENFEKYDDESSKKLIELCKKARENIYSKDYDEEAFVEAVDEIKKVIPKINSDKKYTVTGEKENGIYSWITIKEND